MDTDTDFATRYVMMDDVDTLQGASRFARPVPPASEGGLAHLLLLAQSSSGASSVGMC